MTREWVVSIICFHPPKNDETQAPNWLSQLFFFLGVLRDRLSSSSDNCSVSQTERSDSERKRARCSRTRMSGKCRPFQALEGTTQAMMIKTWTKQNGDQTQSSGGF